MVFNNAVNAKSTGFQSLTSGGVWNGRTLTPGFGVTITNGDGTGGNPVIATTVVPGTFRNLGIAYNGGTGVFSITASDGSALSASNPAYVVIPSKTTPGTLKTYTITTTYSFIDDVGASQIIGNLFGLTTSIATDQDIPFLLYFVANDAETAVTPMISRKPFTTFSPAAADIGKPSSAIADTNFAFWAMDDSITVGDYDTNPVIRVGIFRMRMSNLDDWTVQTLNYSSGNVDGIDTNISDRVWSMPTSQFGAASGQLMANNGGTAPTWGNQAITYQFQIGGTVMVNYHFSVDGGTDGAGAVALTMTLPFMALSPVGFGDNTDSHTWLGFGSGMALRIGIHILSYTANSCFFVDYAGTTVNNNVFGNGNRYMKGAFLYRIGGT